MRVIINNLVILILVIINIVPLPSLCSDDLPKYKEFLLLESTAYENRQSFFKYGFSAIEEFGAKLFWDKNVVNDNLPNKNKVCEIVNNVGDKYEWVVLDIEHWLLSTKYVNENVVMDNVEKYIQVISWARECRPDLKFGYYGQIPIRDHKAVLQGKDSNEKNYWVEQHSRVERLARLVDAIFPSLYTSTESREEWKILAEEYIKMSRKLANGKPVYPYIWPQYHPGYKYKALDFISAEYWRFQLETVYKFADGAVVWGGWNLRENYGPMAWDENKDWWVETKKFINDLSY